MGKTKTQNTCCASALIWCVNLVINKTMLSDWECSHCLFNNYSSSKIFCSLCGNVRPKDYAQKKKRKGLSEKQKVNEVENTNATSLTVDGENCPKDNKLQKEIRDRDIIKKNKKTGSRAATRAKVENIIINILKLMSNQSLPVKKLKKKFIKVYSLTNSGSPDCEMYESVIQDSDKLLVADGIVAFKLNP